MTTRIDARFAELAKEGRAAFVTFLMAGDPDPKTSLDIIKALPKAGADIIEIGMPFTDPMADGPSIQAAGLRALLPHEGSGLLAFGRELVLRFLFRQQLQKDSAPFRIGRVGKQPSIEPNVLIVDELFHFPALRSGRHRRHFQLLARGVHFRT